MALAPTSQNNDGFPPPNSPLLDLTTPTLTPDTDISSDSDTPIKLKTLSKARAKKVRKAFHKTLSASQPHKASLRPAKDILSRIRHDPTLDDDDYIVGYQDRHADIMELPVAMWKGGGDVTEDKFIPQHRVLYFRKRDGVRVWDRKERIDLLFGSGNGDGERQKERNGEGGSGEIRKDGVKHDRAGNEAGDVGDKTHQEGSVNKTEVKDEKAETEYVIAAARLLM